MQACPHGVVSGQCNDCLAGALKIEADMLADLHNVSRSRTCSWCHASNRDTVHWCEHCGHAARLPRMLCDCVACRG